MQLAIVPQRRRRRRSEIAAPALREQFASIIEDAALDLMDPDRIEGLAEEMGLIERKRVHHVGLVVSSLILASMQRSTDTEGRWLDAQRTYEDLGGADAGKTSFRNQIRKMVPAMRELLRRRLDAFVAATDRPELRERLRAFADVLVPDGCAFKVAAALCNLYSGTGQPAELKLHAVYSVRSGGVVSATKTAGSVHDNDGFRPSKWERDALYIWDLGYNDYSRVIDAKLAGAQVLQRLKSGANPVVLASYGESGHRRALAHDDGRPMRLDEACAFGFVHRQHVLDLDVQLTDEHGRTAIMRVVCVPFGGEDRYYLSTLARDIFTAHDLAELYRVRWEVELFFRAWKGALRVDEVRRLSHPLSLEAAVTASLLAGTLAQEITVAINELERLAAAEAFSP